jgi:hypothetical protein
LAVNSHNAGLNDEMACGSAVLSEDGGDGSDVSAESLRNFDPRLRMVEAVAQAGIGTEVLESLEDPICLSNAIAVNSLALDLPLDDISGNGRRQHEAGERLVQNGSQRFADCLPEGWIRPPVHDRALGHADLRRRLVHGGSGGEQRDRLKLFRRPAV